MPKYRIVWMSTSQWPGTKRQMYEEDEIYETREEAEAALAESENDSNLMEDVHGAAVQDQGVEGWIEIKEVR